MAAKTPAVLVDDVSKSFAIPHEAMHTLKERALHPFKRSGFDHMHALHDVSFVVPRGSFYGIVGRNGSGKSTMLKCLAGIYRTDRGEIYVDGRLSTFIELGVGFNPDLAARDNVMLNAVMMGLSSKEAKNRFDSIIDFAELREFVDLKIKNYSSGMLVRLAFSVMIHVDADILLIDEVLAVGDASFQEKCNEEFRRIKASNATVLFVTHNMDAVKEFCDEGVLLERGNLVEVGDIGLVSDRYTELNFSEEARAAVAANAAAAEAVEVAG
jgi:ABC-type polysaccharide/polyol phosphate transport system ATPase subunit